MIPREELDDRGIYVLHSRNLPYGVWLSEFGAFLGIREKFGDRYLDHEYHGPAPQGTAVAKKRLGTIHEDRMDDKSLFETLDHIEKARGRWT